MPRKVQHLYIYLYIYICFYKNFKLMAEGKGKYVGKDLSVGSRNKEESFE